MVKVALKLFGIAVTYAGNGNAEITIKAGGYNSLITAHGINNYKDLFNAIHHTLDKFVKVKAICIGAPRILYTGYLEAFGRHRGKPLDPLHADAF